MRPKQQRARGRCKATWLLLGVSLATACRFGFEQLDVSGSAGDASGAADAGSTSAGAPQTVAGNAPGGSNSAEGGAPVVAGQPGVLEGGAAAAAGAETAGAAGAVSNQGCITTADCSCASRQGRAYWFCTTPSNFDSAQAHCQTQAMQLLRVDSQAENDFVLSTGTTLGVFAGSAFTQIGATDQAVAGEWRWIDGEQFWQGASGGAAVGGLFSHWAGASPSAQGTKRCAGMLSTGFWQDRSCTALATFVCEAP